MSWGLTQQGSRLRAAFCCFCIDHAAIFAKNEVSNLVDEVPDVMREVLDLMREAADVERHLSAARTQVR